MNNNYTSHNTLISVFGNIYHYKDVKDFKLFNLMKINQIIKILRNNILLQQNYL